MQKLAGAILGGLVVLTGCATTGYHPARSTHPFPSPVPDWQSDDALPGEAHAEVSGAPANAPTHPPSAPVWPAGTEPPPELKWLSFNRWAEERGLGPVRRVTPGPAESFALMVTGGVLTLNIGSLAARWENLEIRLGFPPQLLAGQVFVHALDLRKNVEPLLRGFVPETRPDRLVVIDPGHGGSNLGTRSVTDSRTEKYFTLDWALRLAPLLEAKGWRVALTRTNDVDVSLAERVALAEELRADLFVSLHFNSAGGNGPGPSGLETYCLTPVGMTSSLTRGDADDPAQVFPNNAFDELNVMYAVRLHAALLKLNGYVDRGVRRARFLSVLQGQNRPAVLIEGGFLSNPAEARRVAEPEFRQRLAEAVASALGTRMEDGR